MAMITRLSRLFKADFHAVLDHIEEPQVLLRQAIREMEEDLISSEQKLKWLQHETAELGARQKELEDASSRLDEELDICFDSGKDELARGLIKRKLEAQRLLDRIVSRAAATEQAIDAQTARLTENRSVLDGMRQKAELYQETSSANDESAADWLVGDTAVSDADVEVAFLREKKKRSAS